ncbi:hypothetical protein VNO77_04227 [Canavalia gladiata]|uniref:TIR domain-containing protein n=1 Tax=Canavalia gladiata TaxID=3824 RepID=A0AAN9MY74_CANGL
MISSRSPESDFIPPTPGAFRLRWDVFLSFRGTDTRNTITKGLYESLLARGVRVFLDDDGLDRGDEIAPSLLEAIDDSAAFIVIISPKYASSHWCLDELVKICQCRRLILPVFYRVDPNQVRHQSGPFQEGFTSHERKYEENKVRKWREAMKKVGGVAGWVVSNDSEEEDNHILIRRLVKRVMRELRNTPLCVAEFAVGLDKRVENVMNLLQIQSNGVRVLGLYGMGGVGKTTLAKAVFNNLVDRFEHRCFISNVREVSSKDDGLVSLQSKILKDLFPGEVSPTISDVDVGISVVKRRVIENRVLLVLDDVDDVKQLDALIGKREWFYEGSRVIITTRDTRVLPNNHVNELYEVKELYFDEALELFSYHAVRRNKPTENFLNLSQQIVSLTGKMPLALEVFGSFLFGKRRVEEWEDALEKLRGTRHTQGIVLDFEEKILHKNKAESDFPKNLGWIFNLINVSGYIGQCLMNCFLPQVEENREIIVHTKYFEPMVNLRQLEINNMRLEGKFLPAELKWLQWRGCPLENIPLKSWPRELAVLDLKGSNKIENLWGWNSYKVPKNLMVMNLSHCIQLVAIPDLSGCKHLEKIDLEHCISLTRIHESIGSLTTLRSLNLKSCSNLITFPSDVSGLKHLESLILSGCSMLKALPESVSNMKSLKSLLVDDTAIVELPNSIFRLTKLEHLVLDGCQHFRRLPNCIGHLCSLQELSLYRSGLEELPNSVGSLKNLETLNLMWCESLTVMPDCIGNLTSLTELSVDRSAIKQLPSTIGSLSYLRELSVGNCKFLCELPHSIKTLASLVELQLDGTAITSLPDEIGEMKLLRKLEMRNCKYLESLPESIGRLASLTTLNMVDGNIRELPESIGLLENLVTLRLNKCKMLRMLPDSIGNLKSLYHFLMEETAELSILKKLLLPNCSELISLPALPSSLLELNVENCSALETIHDMSNLESLQELKLTNCVKVVDIPGLENFKSLRRLYLSGCTSCSSQIRKRLSKVALRNLQNLSMPGGRLPEWLSRQTVRFSKPKNLELKGAIVGVIISINHNIDIPNMNRDHMPVVIDVQANVLKLGKPLFSTTLNICGVPRTDEEHIHLCRFHDYHQLIAFLKDSDTFCVSRRNPPFDVGLEVKKCGVHLIFEGDDDYDGDEESLDKGLQSVSEKLANFFNNYDGGDPSYSTE